MGKRTVLDRTVVVLKFSLPLSLLDCLAYPVLSRWHSVCELQSVIEKLLIFENTVIGILSQLIQPKLWSISPRMRTKEISWCVLLGKPIKFGKWFNYLDLPFSFTGKFFQAYQHFSAKGNRAITSVHKVSIKSRTSDIKVRNQLLIVLINCTLLYAGEIWAFNYVGEVENAQLKFIKQIYNISKFMPNSFVLLEYGLDPLKVQVLLSMIRMKAYCRCPQHDYLIFTLTLFILETLFA